MKDVYTVEEAATMLGVHAQTVRVWIRQGKVPALRYVIGGNYRITRETLERLMTEQVMKQSPNPTA